MLKGLDFVLVYLDDVLIFSKNSTDHNLHVRQVLDRLREHKLYAHEDKCEFFKTEIEYLGHVVTPEGIQMEPSKVASILSWKVPQNSTDVRAFLGLAGYYRAFVGNFSDIAAPLTDLTGHAAFVWTRIHQESFDRLKLAVASAPVLARADTRLPFVVMTDASDYGVGAVLQQDRGAGMQPVCFLSHKLSSAERNYPVHERELLAIIIALRTWRHYLQDARYQVVVQTDHQALRFFQDQPKRSPRQVRWQAFLSDYNVQIEYVKGEENPVADACSRRAELRLAAIRACADSDPLPAGDTQRLHLGHRHPRSHQIPQQQALRSLLHAIRYAVLHRSWGRALVCSCSRYLAG